MKSRFIHTTALAIMMATLAACRGGFAAKDDVDAPLAVDGVPGTGDAAADAAPVDAAPADATANYPARPPVYFSDPIGVHPKVQVHAPADYTPTSAYPLVIFLCGSGSCAAYEGWWPIAAHEVVYAMPLSSLTPGTTDARFWNASAACCDFANTGVDDVAYLGGLIDRVSAAYHIDSSLVVVVGASNGGFMAERLACDRSDVVTEIIDLAGAVRDSRDPICSPSHQVAALVDHSEGDQAVRWNGGPLHGGTWPAPPVTGLASTTDRGDCSLPAFSPDVDHDPAVPGVDTLVSDYECERGHLTFWHERASVHCFIPTAAWSSDAWAWMQAHRRN